MLIIRQFSDCMTQLKSSTTAVNSSSRPHLRLTMLLISRPRKERFCCVCVRDSHMPPSQALLLLHDVCIYCTRVFTSGLLKIIEAVASFKQNYHWSRAAINRYLLSISLFSVSQFSPQVDIFKSLVLFNQQFRTQR